MPSETVPLLRDRVVLPGERWIYSAGFNVRPDLGDTARIDSEVPDLRRLLDAGARVAILSHQGDHAAGSARHLDDIARLLSAALGSPVRYEPEAVGASAVAAAAALTPGTAALFGNARHHAGEQRGDPALAAEFARLGEQVAVGGFSKAHRAHASNVGLLNCRPGWLADSVALELEALRPWAGGDPRLSVAALGGTKKEKTTVGLPRLVGDYDVVVPGGAVLHHVLRALGYDLGASDPGEDPVRCTNVAHEVLSSPTRARFHVPDHVVIARGSRRQTVAVADGVPSGWAIVDVAPQPWLLDVLRDLAGGGRALLAGTPCRYLDGDTVLATTLLDAFAAPSVDALLVGGDTVAELPWRGPTSTGGGAALYYLAHGTCPLLSALTSTRRETHR